MPSRAQMHAQQQQGRRHASHARLLDEFDWRGAAAGLILMGLITAIGPFTLLLAWLIWRWCSRSVFDPQNRWNSIRVFAWLLTPLMALAIAAFFVLPHLALHLWSSSPLHLLGAPDLLNNLWLRWLVSLPLALALSFILERGDPRTIRSFLRTRTAKEQVLIDEARQRAQEQTRIAQEEALKKQKRAEERKAAAARRRVAALIAEIQPETAKSHTTASLDVQAPTLWAPSDAPQPPAPEKQKPAKPDLGDGSMDALL